MWGMMEQDLCDVCGRPATHFVNSAHCFNDGRLGSSSSIKLCAVHAEMQENVTAQATLISLLTSWRQLAAFAEPTDWVEVTFDASDNASADRLASDLKNGFGGNAASEEWPGGWVVIWRLSATAETIDQWECEGWSQRVLELARHNQCKLSGFALPARGV